MNAATGEISRISARYVEKLLRIAVNLVSYPCSMTTRNIPENTKILTGIRNSQENTHGRETVQV